MSPISYVQGTVITVDVKINDSDTGQPTDPDDVIVLVVPGDKPTHQPPLAKYTLRYSDDELERRSQGLYRFRINTAAAYGLWEYQVDAEGGEAVVKQRKLRVIPRWT